jgi:hypothetical protein
VRLSDTQKPTTPPARNSIMGRSNGVRSDPIPLRATRKGKGRQASARPIQVSTGLKFRMYERQTRAAARVTQSICMRKKASAILASRARTGFGWGEAAGVDGWNGCWGLSGLWCMIVMYHHSMGSLPLQPMRSLRMIPRPHAAAGRESIKKEY